MRSNAGIANKIYRYLDLSENIEIIQEGVKGIGTRPARLWGWLLTLFLLMSFGVMAWVVDIQPSYTYGKQIGTDLKTTGIIAGLFLIGLTFLPSAAEIMSPLLGRRLWFLNRMADLFYLYDGFTDYPLVSEFVDKRMGQEVLIHPLADTALVYTAKYSLLIASSMLVELIFLTFLAGFITLTMEILRKDLSQFKTARRALQ